MRGHGRSRSTFSLGQSRSLNGYDRGENARNNSWHFLGRQDLDFAFGIFAQFPKNGFLNTTRLLICVRVPGQDTTDSPQALSSETWDVFFSDLFRLKTLEALCLSGEHNKLKESPGSMAAA